MAKFSRMTVLAAVAGALFVGQIGAASAIDNSDSSDKSDDSSKVAVTASTSTGDCIGSNAVSNVVYKVDGKVVPKLRGNAAQGATVTVDFKVKSNCDDVKLGLAAYEAPSAKWVPAEAKDQVLVDSDAATLAANATKTFSVTLPSCYYQVDFFTGVPVEQLDERGGYFNGNLIDADNGGKNKCEDEPPVVEECPTSQAARITDYSYTINGKSGIKDLEGQVIAGKKVKVTFTIAENCTDQELSLVAYEAPSDTFSEDTADKQVLFDSDTGKFDEGQHSLEVTVPECYFQVDFVKGGVLETLGPKGSDNFYGDRLIDADTGGKECVVETPEETTTTTTVKAPTTTTTEAPTTTTTQAPTTTSTTLETEVLGEVIEEEEETEVASEELAQTGLETIPLTMLGGGLTLGGLALQGLAARLRQNKKN